MKIKLITLLVAMALVSTLSVLAVEAMAEVRAVYLSAPIIVAQGDATPVFGTEEQSIQMERERVIMTKDYEKPSARPDFCNYDYEPRGGPTYPPAEFVPPC